MGLLTANDGTSSSTGSTVGKVLGMIPVAGAAAQAIYGMFTKGSDQAKQQELQSENEQRQLANSEANETYQQQLQMKTWNDTNYEAQVQHIKNAGLNPALLYGGGGGGGATTGGSGSPMGLSQAPDANAMTANKTQQAMALAQLGLTQAQTENVKAQTEKIENTDTPNIQATTANTQADTTLKGLQASGQQLQNELQTINNNIAGETSEYVKENIREQTQKTQSEIQKLMADSEKTGVEGDTLKAAKDSIIANYNAQLDNTMANTLQMRANTNLSAEQAKAITQKIDQDWSDINNQHADRQQMMKTILIGAGINAAGNLVGDLIGLQGAKIKSNR